MVKQRSEFKDERRARILYGETTPRWGGAYRWLNDEPEEVQDYYADQPPGGVPMWKPPEQTQRQSGAVRREPQQDQPKNNFANLDGSLHQHASEPSPLKSNISGDRTKFGNRGNLAGSTANPVNSKALGAGMLARKSGAQTANFATQDQTSKKLASDASQFAVQRAKTSVKANNQEDIQMGLAQKAQSSETSPKPDKRLTLPGNERRAFEMIPRLHSSIDRTKKQMRERTGGKSTRSVEKPMKNMELKSMPWPRSTALILT